MTNILLFSSLKALFQWAIVGSSCAFIFMHIQNQLPLSLLHKIALITFFSVVSIILMLILINGSFIAMLTSIAFALGVLLQVIVTLLTSRFYLLSIVLAKLQQLLPKSQNVLPKPQQKPLPL